MRILYYAVSLASCSSAMLVMYQWGSMAGADAALKARRRGRPASSLRLIAAGGVRRDNAA